VLRNTFIEVSKKYFSFVEVRVGEGEGVGVEITILTDSDIAE
jgi:hypothetical protein